MQQTHTEVQCPAGSPASVCSSGELVTVSTHHTVDYSTQNGWFVDFSRAGERDNTNPALTKGTLTVVTNRPSSTSCSIGGDSFLYNLDYRTGGPVSSSPTYVVGTSLGNYLANSPSVFCLQNGTCFNAVQGAGNELKIPPIPPNSFTDGVSRRVSWRELMVQ